MLIKIYVLADKLICFDLKNGITDLVKGQSERKFVLYSDMQLLIDAGFEGSRLMSLMIDQVGYELSESYPDAMKANDWSEFLDLGADVTRRVMDEMYAVRKHALKKAPAAKLDCKYHYHGGEQKTVCKMWAFEGGKAVERNVQVS